MRIIESWAMTEMVEDWSRVRSPSRARRRLKRGIRQNVRTLKLPRKDAITIDGGQTYYVHPETAKVLYAEMDRRNRTTA